MKGTLDFMSVEVEKQSYRYLPPDSKVTFFYHNSLQELESVWWLATWIIFFHYPVRTAIGSLIAQKAAINELFPRILPNDRSLFIDVSMKFNMVVDSLHVDFRPYGRRLDDLRAALGKAYSNFEACLVDESSIEHIKHFDENSLSGIHDTFRLTFQEMKGELSGNSGSKDVELIRLHKVTVKRKLTPKSDDIQGKRRRYVLCFKFESEYDFNP
jgi:hypothetical protein